MRLWSATPLLFAACAAAATFNPQGLGLTVNTGNLQVTFSGPDVVGIANQLTGESYLRNPSPNMQLNLALVQPPNAALAPVGSWTVNAAGTSANLTVSDSNRTVSVVVSVDPASQQIVVVLDGKANQGGVETLTWGATGFDMTAGRFILPAVGGISLTAASFSARNSYSFNGYWWEAPLALFQGAQGGVAIYSLNPNSLCRDLTVSANQQQTANLLIQTEAPGPWSKATEAGPIEWRLAAYAGDWQSGARIYRDAHNTALPPALLTGPRAWANNIRTVIEYADWQPYDPATLDSLAAVVVPSQTLLYLVDWRSTGFDATWPDYTWAPATPAFIAHAHKLGFYVMLHTDALGCSPVGPDYPAVQQYQLKDPLTLQPQGWLWNQPPSTPNRYAIMDPAAPAWRQLWLARVTPAIQTLQPDAIHMDYSFIYNDGNGLFNGMNFNQGLAQMTRDLLAAFPSLVVGAESTSDMTAPWQSFSQPVYWTTAGFDPNVTPPVPVSAYVLGNVRRYWHLGTTDPGTPGFTPNLAQYEGQAVLPTFRTEISDYTQPDVARFLNVIHAFQQYGLQLAWDANWNGAEMKYQGANGSSATLTDSGTLVQFSLTQAGSSSVLYRRAHDVNQIDSAFTIPNWPAFNGSLTLGLDPGIQYFLDTPPNRTSLPHLTALPGGARVGMGTGTLVTPQFAYFQVLPPVAQSGFNFLSGLWTANTGVTYNGADYPLANGATASLATTAVGGITRQVIACQPPWMAQVGGETFVEYSVPLPAVGGTAFSFAVGIADWAIGYRQDPMTFKVEVNGAVLWQQDVGTGGWQPGSIDLSPWTGQTVKIRLASNPGPLADTGFAGGSWSVLQLTSANPATLDGITVSSPVPISATSVVTTGGAASVSNNGTVTVNGLPYGGTVLLFTGRPVAVSAGQSLLSIPFTLSQSSNGMVAGPPTNAYGGTGGIGPTTSGGVTKQALNAFGPANGQTIFSWLLQIPDSPLAFSFSAGFWDGVGAPSAQGYLMSVRINGTVLWQRNINVPPSWQNGTVDLSSWSGQTVVLELITDTLGPNYDDFTSWGDLTFAVPANAACIPSVTTAKTVTVPAGGGSISASVTAGAGCSWTATSPVDWITATPASAVGNGTAAATIAPNPGPARQANVVLAGHIVAVQQAGAILFSGPEISSVVTVAGGAAATASNAWLEIYGINLSASTRAWQAADFAAGQMPAQLDGVSVTVNGQPAFVEYISPGQVNVLTPVDTAQGTVRIQVTSGGVAGTPIYIPMQTAVPGFFMFSGSPYIAATHVDGSYLGPVTLYPGASTPARPGEVVTLYAGGFGQTDPPIVNGSQTQSGTLPTQPVITVGGVRAPVQFAGVISPGLYQFNVEIPASTPDGDAAVTATYRGFSTQAGAMIAVRANPPR